MKLTILGSGTMVPENNRYPSSYLVEQGATRVLIDCGFLTIARLREHDVDIQSIDAVAISHFHTDHFGHLLPLVHARFVEDMYEDRSHRPLTVFGPATLKERWEKMREVSWPEPEEGYPLTFCEGAVGKDVEEIHMQSFPIHHVRWFESVGYTISAAGRSLAYTGDLGPRQGSEFTQKIESVDVLLVEATASRSAPNHLTAKQAIDMAREARVGRVILTHLSGHLLDEARDAIKNNEGFVTLAEDNVSIEV